MLTLFLTSLLTLSSDVQLAEASGTIYIRPDGSIDPLTVPIQRDGDLYTFIDNIAGSIVVQRDGIVIDGNGYTLQGTGAEWSGFDLSIVSYVTVKNAHITRFQHGVLMYYSDIPPPTGPYETMPVSNTIAYNIITNCSWGVAIWIQDSTWTSHDHLVVGNIIRNNEIGVGLAYTTRYNKVYHNNFLNNTHQGYDITGQTNYWTNDYPSGGNYWSDYTGSDTYSGPHQNEPGSDGIGDTPYSFEDNTQDNYPLMNPYVPLLGDLKRDGKVDLRDLSIAALAFGSYPNHPSWNSQTDINQDDKIDIRDLVLIAKNFGKTWSP